MSLAPGARLGPYEVLAAIGVGGMGEVYRARDSKLNRDVALKILPESFANDSERLARFQREAQVLASLNHQNIGSIYGLEDAAGVRALVLELVEGPTLADRIEQGPIPLDEALPIAKQIAEALETAHEQGIIHRDLKPANIKLRPDGTVKVLDFGLAKAMGPNEGPAQAGHYVGNMDVRWDRLQADLSQSPTITSPAMMTGAGVILGTAAYMSPEQARGKPLDKRTDIWAFGCVLYEMLTATRAFPGEDVTETLAAIVRGEPDWNGLPAQTPPSIQRLLRRALTKERRERLADASDARIEINETLTRPDADSQVAATMLPRRTRERLAWTLAAVGLLVGSVTLGFGYLRPPPNDVAVTRFLVSPPEGAIFEPTNLHQSISPDGRRLAFLARRRAGEPVLLWVRSLEAVTPEALAGTEGAGTLFWSPDSQSIGFIAQGKLKRIEVAGGPVQTLSDAPQVAPSTSGSWSQDGTIVFRSSVDGYLSRVSGRGGTPVPVTTLDTANGETGHFSPQFLPDGRQFLYYARPQNAVFLASLDSMTPKRLLMADSKAVYSPGYLLFVRQGTLLGQGFSAERGELTGEPFVVAGEVRFNANNGSAGFSVSDNGILTHRTGEAGVFIVQMAWFDRTGKPLGAVGEPGPYVQMTLSPDGRQAALQRRGDLQPFTSDIWLVDVARGVASRFTFDAASEIGPTWSPDGTRIAFSRIRTGVADIFEKPIAGGDETLLLEGGGSNKYPESYSRDGRFLAYHTDTKTLNVLPLSGDRKPFPFLETPFEKDEAQFSPDGRWLAYVSDDSGRAEVYVQPFSGPGQKVLISTNGGGQPKWRKDGKEIFYLGLDGMLMSVGVKGGETLEPGTPTLLFQTGIVVDTGLDQYAVSPDGQRFLTLTAFGDTAQSPITVVVNWQAALKN